MFQVDGAAMDLPLNMDNSMLQGQVDTLREMGKLGMRNIHAWEREFDEQLKTYKNDYEGMKCTARAELDKQLIGIEKQIERVRRLNNFCNKDQKQSWSIFFKRWLKAMKNKWTN